MRTSLRAGLGLAALAAALTAVLAQQPAQAAQASTAHHYSSQRTCATAASGSAACHARVRTDSATPHATTASPAGLNPVDLLDAYKLTALAGSNGGSQTIAIVDAYNDPTAEADLGVYRAQFGLSACTTANGCFKKVNQTGGTSYPATDAGWALEISLDLDMASAICPNCKILLVEATSSSFANLGAAENYAAAHATVVSNSWGGSDARDTTYGSYFNHSGVAITVSSGDSGYGAEYPASSHYVTAVGGTKLTKATGTSRGWTETAWTSAGSGCSKYNTALSGASTFGTGCSKRAEADVSAVADPASGVSVYDSTVYSGQSGWWVVGGTSASAPIVAGVYALAGNAASISNNTLYTGYSSANFFDVTSGSNGSCTTTQWCNARAGWDGPTGLGTPNGVAGF
ncbi:S53 family peptidase [Hamadaea tsunoensis]|uniref:S53 family peptidase n=1 Tax=Hamadaea tsunoensis TaxID=53368 RepID=UPI0004028860|nr:S53 family peptidase [Hamadaea tsunoensis]